MKVSKKGVRIAIITVILIWAVSLFLYIVPIPFQNYSHIRVDPFFLFKGKSSLLCGGEGYYGNGFWGGLNRLDCCKVSKCCGSDGYCIADGCYICE